VENRDLVKISLACSLAGIGLIYGLSLMVEPKAISVNLLDRYEGRIVSVEGTIVDLRNHEAGHIFLKMKDESGTCEIPLFASISDKVPSLSLGDRIHVVGTVEEYRDSKQVVPRTDRDVQVLESPPVSIAEARGMVGETVKLQGISYSVRGSNFRLTDGNESIEVRSSAQYLSDSGRNVTISGTVRRDDVGVYLSARQLLALSARVETTGISDIRQAGVFLIHGVLRLDASGPLLDDGTGRFALDPNLLSEAMVDGDEVEAIVSKGCDEMNTLEVELDKTSTIPLERLSEELVGRTVRVKGTVISRFVSGENMFLTLYNKTELDVPIFKVGGDLNIQVGDILTVSGRVGTYQDKLQVVPNNISRAKIESPTIVDRELDEITVDDIYTVVRTRGRISSLKRYAKSCSISLKGNEKRISVYLTFQPYGNLSVGTEIEVIGLVKKYKDELELVPRGKEDIG